MSNQRLLVVGASAGIGRAVALAAAARGSDVMIAARRADLLDQIAAEMRLSTAGGRMATGTCDVRDESSCRAVVDRAISVFGGLDALVYAAGFGQLRSLAEADLDYWRAVFDVNVAGAAQVARFAMPALEQSAGHALFMSSPTARRPWPNQVPYSASKAALDSLVDGLRAEHPGVSFTSVIVHPTESDFDSDWDSSSYRAVAADWIKRGYVAPRGKMPASHMAEAVLHALASPAEMAVIDVRRRPERPDA